jgi:hypothetical protein
MQSIKTRADRDPTKSNLAFIGVILSAVSVACLLLAGCGSGSNGAQASALPSSMSAPVAHKAQPLGTITGGEFLGKSNLCVVTKSGVRVLIHLQVDVGSIAGSPTFCFYSRRSSLKRVLIRIVPASDVLAGPSAMPTDHPMPHPVGFTAAYLHADRAITQQITGVGLVHYHLSEAVAKLANSYALDLQVVPALSSNVLAQAFTQVMGAYSRAVQTSPAATSPSSSMKPPSTAKSSKPACNVLTSGEMGAILGRPVQAMNLTLPSSDNSPYRCVIGSESTAGTTQSATMPYFYWSIIDYACGTEAQVLQQAWTQFGSQRVPGAVHDVRRSPGTAEAGYFIGLKNGCALNVTPAYNLHGGTGTVTFSTHSKAAVVAAIDAAYDRA